MVLLGPCLGSCGPSQLSLRLTDDSEMERKELSVNDPKKKERKKQKKIEIWRSRDGEKGLNFAKLSSLNLIWRTNHTFPSSTVLAFGCE